MRPYILGVCSLLATCNALSAGPNEYDVAGEVDRLLVEGLAAEQVTPAPIVNDEDFLRRVYLDLAGIVPSPKDVTVFGLNPDSKKRSKTIDRLLESPKYAKLWGSYWRDVIMSRATEQRARIVEPAFESWLTEQFEQNRSWDEITRTLLTATGPVRETGETGLIFAHTGDPQELAAEISRVFLGIQMSCANCHDHPTDSWKREDFHQLAAFLPRISVRREEPGDPTSWAVRSVEERGFNRGRSFEPKQLFTFLDRNRDGFLTKAEARGPLASRFDQMLTAADADQNGKLSREEFAAARPPMNEQPGRGELDYYMPDLANPASKGTMTQPVFFLSEVRGPRLSRDADDLIRRHALADYITSPTNPWFARAFVNRMWSELLGQGFFMPIDDLGPERSASFENVLDVLAQGFVDSGYDVKWVFRTITNTQAYQRQMRSSQPDEFQLPFAAATPSRLSSDQLYQSLFEVLGTSAGGNLGGNRFRGLMYARSAGRDPGRIAFREVFGEDPSTPQEDLIGNVPQALFMMNSTQIEQQVRGSGNTRLARLLREFDRDVDALNELYLLVLSREPTENEVSIATEYITNIKDRTEAFEDIMWSLLNSTEFLSKR